MLWSLTATVLRFAGILLVLPFVLRSLAAEEMGLWYLFLSIGGLCGYFDLGFSPAVARSVAYLWAGAPTLQVSGHAASLPGASAPLNQQLFADLLVTIQRFAAGVALTALLAVGCGGGLWIWHQTGTLPHAESYRWAWVVYVLCASYAYYSGIWIPLLNGLNGVRPAQQSFVWALLVNYGSLLILLSLKFGLWALVLASFLQGLTQRILCRRAFDRFVRLRTQLPLGSFQWDLLKILWPQAWRGAALTFGIYVTLNAGTLACSFLGRLDLVASYGLSLQLALALTQVATIPLAVKLPFLSQSRISAAPDHLWTLVLPRIRLYWIICLVGSGFLLTGGDYIFRHVIQAKTSLLPLQPLSLLFLVLICEGNCGLFREIKLTHNQNPFTGPVLLSALLIAGLSIPAGMNFGAIGIILTHGLIQASFNYWWIPQVALASLHLSLREFIRKFFGGAEKTFFPPRIN